MSKRSKPFTRPPVTIATQHKTGNDKMSVDTTVPNEETETTTANTAEQNQSSEGSEVVETTSTSGNTVESTEPQMLSGTEFDNATTETAPVQPEVIVTEKVVPSTKPKATATASISESMSVSMVREDIANYIKNMAPGMIISEKKGSQHQARFFNVILAVINRYSDDDFKAAMDIIVKAFRTEAKGVFGAQYVYRFMEHVELPSPRVTLFQRLINMFIIMAEPKSRVAAMKQLNWQDTLSGEITNEGRNRVLKYFDVG